MTHWKVRVYDDVFKSVIHESDAELIYKRINPEWDGTIFQYVINFFTSVGFKWSGEILDDDTSFFYK